MAAPQYRLTTRRFIDSGPPFGGSMYEPGDEIEYEGCPGPDMIPLNDEAHEALVKYYEDNPHQRIHANAQPPEAEKPGKPLLVKKGEAKKPGLSLAEAQHQKATPGGHVAR